MNRLRRTILLALPLVTASAPAVAHAQVPKMQMPRELPSGRIVVSGNMVVIIGAESVAPTDPFIDLRRPQDARDSTLAAMRRIADSAGYKLVVSGLPQPTLVDSAGYSVYGPPPGVRFGFILLGPGRRPQLIPNRLTVRGLRQALDRHSRGVDTYFVSPIPSGG